MSASTVQETWTATPVHMQGARGTAYFGKQSLRVKGASYIILEVLAECNPVIEVQEFHSKLLAYSTIESITELQSAICEISVNGGSAGGRAAECLESYYQ